MKLQVSELDKSFETASQRVEVLRDISFAIASGESMVVTGPSGSGKSTLLHIVGTLEPPSSGHVEIDGRDPFELSEPELAAFRNRSIGFVFQDHHLLPQYSVLENVRLPTLAFPGRADDGAEERARRLVDDVGLGHRLDHRPAELSGGERQRVAIARALINAPGLLLCDEPTGNLDVDTAGAVAELILELHERESNILVVVTHSLELAARFPRRFDLAAPGTPGEDRR